jgi:hypothetical protein
LPLGGLFAPLPAGAVSLGGVVVSVEVVVVLVESVVETVAASVVGAAGVVAAGSVGAVDSLSAGAPFSFGLLFGSSGMISLQFAKWLRLQVRE